MSKSKASASEDTMRETSVSDDTASQTFNWTNFFLILAIVVFTIILVANYILNKRQEMRLLDEARKDAQRREEMKLFIKALKKCQKLEKTKLNIQARQKFQRMEQEKRDNEARKDAIILELTKILNEAHKDAQRLEQAASTDVVPKAAESDQPSSVLTPADDGFKDKSLMRVQHTAERSSTQQKKPRALLSFFCPFGGGKFQADAGNKSENSTKQTTNLTFPFDSQTVERIVEIMTRDCESSEFHSGVSGNSDSSATHTSEEATGSMLSDCDQKNESEYGKTKKARTGIMNSIRKKATSFVKK